MNGFLYGATLGLAIGIGLGMILLATLQAMTRRDRDNLQRTYDLMTREGRE